MAAVRSTPIRRSARPPVHGVAVPREVLAPKPWSDENVAAIHDLAVKLAGEPVPGWRLTPTQFLDWCEPDVKAEWIDGEVVLMSPEGWENVNLITWLTRLLGDFVETNELGELLGREMLIRLPNQRRLRAPDLQFIARSRRSIIQPTHIDGAPDLAIECVSPTSAARDWRVKYGEYEKAGIREYWVFDPLNGAIEAYALGRDKRYAAIREQDGAIHSRVLRGFHFRRAWLAANRRPSVKSVLKELATKR